MSRDAGARGNPYLEIRAHLRRTRANQYSLNAVTAVLDACDVAWSVWDDPRQLGAPGGRRSLVLYSFMTTDLGWVRDEVAALRRERPGLVLVAGGAHATADPVGTLALGFDHVFAGEAERSLSAFLRQGGEGEAVLRDPDGGPPALDDFPPFGRGRWGPVELSRGCRWGCAFCAVGRRRVRHRSPEVVLAAVERLRAAGRRTVAFITSDALSYGDGLGDLEHLLRGVRALGAGPVLGTFPSEVRPERLTLDAAELLGRYCHNRTVVIGAQSGSDDVLRRLGRGHTVGQVVEAARNARAAGLEPHVDLIVGLPEETLEERLATIALARQLRRETGARIHAHYFHPLPGTLLWGQDPTPLDPETRRALLDLRAGGAEDGYWQEHERWTWRVIEWARRGWIQTPRTPAA